MTNKVISLAPMMDYTDRFCRYLMRLISPHVRLYTEMITPGAILYGDRERHLKFHPQEHPVAIQLGGSNISELTQAAKIAAEYGYDEINLNVGCPSDRVQNASFGACLMKQPTLVADIIAALNKAVNIPITVKTRIGVDDYDSDELLHAFIQQVAAAGCNTFIIHARKAWLQGLNPKENRTIPPLQYSRVNKVKSAFPELTIILNGGINTIDEIKQHLANFDGVMIGRAIYQDPYLLAKAEQEVFNNTQNILSRHEIVIHYIDYIKQELSTGTRLTALTKPLLGLFHCLGGAKAWRRYLSENAHKRGADEQVVQNALAFITAD